MTMSTTRARTNQCQRFMPLRGVGPEVEPLGVFGFGWRGLERGELPGALRPLLRVFDVTAVMVAYAKKVL
jgi:hypothetical protein